MGVDFILAVRVTLHFVMVAGMVGYLMLLELFLCLGCYFSCIDNGCGCLLWVIGYGIAFVQFLFVSLLLFTCISFGFGTA